jgi:hypothetical protein
MLPRWVFWLMALRSFSAGRSPRLGVWCERMLGRLVAPADRAALTIAIYHQQTMYQAGQPFFSRGLFQWELQLFHNPYFPRAGTVLVPAAGGGRELSWFIEQGFSVEGFDPAPSLVSSWNLTHPDHSMFIASYADLLQMFEAKAGPLASLSERSFDAIVLGWGSLSHLIEEKDRRQLFMSLRQKYPKAVVAVSFLSSCDKDASRAPGTEHTYFLPWAGFVCLLGRISLQRLVEPCGYRIVFYSDETYSHALLYPM